MTATLHYLPLVGVPPVPPGARAVTGPMGWPDQMALKRAGEIARTEAAGLQCTNTRLALKALSDACDHWAVGHTLAMCDALDMFAMLWRSRERAP